jgi:hypothetical protein
MVQISQWLASIAPHSQKSTLIPILGSPNPDYKRSEHLILSQVFAIFPHCQSPAEGPGIGSNFPRFFPLWERPPNS